MVVTLWRRCNRCRASMSVQTLGSRTSRILGYRLTRLVLVGACAPGLLRQRRHRRVRAKLSGTAARPRLAVYRSNARIYAQLIDDEAGHTLAAASSGEKQLVKTSRADAPAAVGKLIAERAKAAGIETVVFDRGGYLYHGRVKALADAAREGGLEF